MTPDTTKNLSPPSRANKRREPESGDEDQHPFKKMRFSEAEMIEMDGMLTKMKFMLRDVKESLYRCERLLYENKKDLSINTRNREKKLKEF